jgi:hypothetical protein
MTSILSAANCTFRAEPWNMQFALELQECIPSRTCTCFRNRHADMRASN